MESHGVTGGVWRRSIGRLGEREVCCGCRRYRYSSWVLVFVLVVLAKFGVEGIAARAHRRDRLELSGPLGVPPRTQKRVLCVLWLRADLAVTADPVVLGMHSPDL